VVDILSNNQALVRQVHREGREDLVSGAYESARQERGTILME